MQKQSFVKLQREFRSFDWLNALWMFSLLSIGLLFILSATYEPDYPFSLFFKKQLIGIVLGTLLYLFCTFKDLRTLVQWGYYGYFATLALLVYTLTSGFIGMGAKRWISLYFFRFQPSELIKLTLPFFLAVNLANLPRVKNLDNSIPFSHFVRPMIWLAITFVLILRQPDLGTALLILFSGLTILWVAGLPRWFLLVGLILSVVSAPIGWKVLKPYQQKRVLSLLGYGSAQKERYQIEQSKIAIGSGGLYGQGLLKGTQNQLGFLPEDHTDFIFAVVCEEWGFLGALSIIALFCMLFTRLVWLALSMPLLFEYLLTFGLSVPLMYSFLINIGMVLGLLPTVGIPLPFFTYGLTHTWVSMMTLGVLNNLAKERDGRL